MFEMRNGHLSSSSHWKKVIHSHPFWAWWIFFYIPIKDHPPHWGAKAKRNLLSSLNDQMPDAGRQMWKNGVPKMLSSHHWKTEMSKNKTKLLKKEPRKMENQRKKEMNEGTTKKILHMTINDPWSDHPETQFGPTYPFFRNPEPRPTLRTWKVHFDWTWILGLKSFLPWEIFHNQQGCCLFSSANKKILINLSLIRDKFWIVKCIIG